MNKENRTFIFMI